MISVPSLRQILFAYLGAFRVVKRSRRLDLSWKPNLAWPALKVFPAQVFITCPTVTSINLDDNALTVLANVVATLSLLTGAG